ncbi:MAG: ribonuclease P protein component [Bacteroidetes bacterium]|nr:ribonuclease P protein component [Bacteroidota bacterium]
MSKFNSIKSKPLFQRAFLRDGISQLRYKSISVRYFVLPTDRATVNCAFIVSKKQFKKAVARNRLKRLMREAFRNNFQPLNGVIDQGENHSYYLFWRFAGSDMASYAEVETHIKELISRILKDTSIKTL